MPAWSGIGVERHVVGEPHQQRVEKTEARGRRPHCADRAQFRYRRIGGGERRRAQGTELGGNNSSVPRSTRRCPGFHQSLDGDGEVDSGPWSAYMGDVAEGVNVAVEVGVGGDVDPPVGDVLPIMAAGRHAQERWITPVGGGS